MSRDYKSELEEKFKNEETVFIFDNFKKALDKIECYCPKHDYKTFISPLELLRPKRKRVCEFCDAENKIKHFGFDIVEIFRSKRRLKVKIKCPECHGVYTHNVESLSEKTKCPLCSQWTNERLIRLGKGRYGDRYDYSEIDVKKWDTKVKITCTWCNNSFWQTPANHLLGEGGCHT